MFSEWRVQIILKFTLACFTQRVASLDIVRFYPMLDFTKETGRFSKLDDRAFSSNQAGCAAKCTIDGNDCIGFAYSLDRKKCVKSYTVGDLDKLSIGHWKTYYSKSWYSLINMFGHLPRDILYGHDNLLERSSGPQAPSWPTHTHRVYRGRPK